MTASNNYHHITHISLKSPVVFCLLVISLSMVLSVLAYAESVPVSNFDIVSVNKDTQELKLTLSPENLDIIHDGLNLIDIPVAPAKSVRLTDSGV